MKRTLIYAALLAAVLPAWGTPAHAADPARDQDRIYGSQIMTEQERNEYRDRMRAAKTEQEREQIRAEHHERMQARAREKGMTLPDEPPARERGMGPGMGGGAGGMGPGMGGGAGGMGPGMGGGRRY